ncbi:MAG: hypothetical protein COU31_03650 [Candidatus Magasanikbacteria bacterium CG10_big_fil_rev_8_21_14_0_10_40_10]|uniref:Uncharacterized protein n=1 Tax=Candidatus Magasanikbacteria bacterium CG10_big_fil_rev_8_21_14_0_10_40_10 TaxID=1974648 RepID=A0A2M6W3K2_9BACT|nr:MAG: hypothetical protein COU31_03650 [Candidatus Magasanikbacteria bacterium CG10_big_fil_rev_8_21_14_0_10_40_10]
MITYFGIGLIVLCIYVSRKARETKDNVDVVMSTLMVWPFFLFLWPMGLIWLYVIDKDIDND